MASPNTKLINKKRSIAANMYKVNSLVLSELIQKKSRSKLIIKMNSGVMSYIYSQALTSFSDFSGILLGKTKFITKRNEIYYLIDNYVIVFDNSYLDYDDKIKKLKDKLQLRFPDRSILGIFSCYSYSYPKLSLKMQKRYFTVKNIMHVDKSDAPFIFGTFSHSSNIINNIPQKVFDYAFWIYGYDDNRFHTVKFSLINLGFGQYTNEIIHNSNKSLYNLVNINIFENQVENLINQIKKVISNIEDKKNEENMIDEIKDLKEQIGNESNEFINILKSVKK